MLYLWPYIAFFSLPLVAISLLKPTIHRLPDSQTKASLLNNLAGPSKITLPGIISSALFLVFGLLSVHYNTIIHPFTLADNRHYVFYVFRILRQHPAIKYLAVPAYFLCAWLVLATLRPSSRMEERGRQEQKESQPTKAKADSKPCQASFIIVWLASTALSVVTAPLVEPRYFIVPWLMWRLHVPTMAASLPRTRPAGRVSLDVRLGLETAWHLIINAAVGYLFLYRGFAWPSEPGKTQRFLF